MTQPNPLYVANTAQNMARQAHGADAKVFQRIAMISMGVMALASVVTVLQPLIKELNRRHCSGQDHDR